MSAISLKQYSLYASDWTRWSAPLARVIAVLLSVWLLWLLVRLVLLLISGPEVVVNVPVTRPAQNSAASTSVDLARWHLFGRAAVGNPLQLSELPETPLDLQLRGIASGTQSDQEGHAIIVDGGGRQWVYKVGDEVPGGAVVKAITPQQVVLERNGQNEALSLPQLRQQRAGSTNRQAGNGGIRAAAGLVNAPRQLAGLRGQPQSLAGLSIPGGVLSGAQLNNVNFEQLSQSVQVTPVNGGYKVFPGRNATIFRQLGLQANDVITAVNGQPITNPQAAMRLFQNLDSASAVTISVRRGNQVVQLQPDLSALRGQ